MRPLLIIVLALLGARSDGQVVKELHPVLGYLVEKSPEGEMAFQQRRAACEALWQQGYGNLPVEHRKQLEECDEEPELQFESYHDVPVGPGCSWYCGGGMDTLSASSELRAEHGRSYAAKNAHDLSYATAWVEGVPGPGIGESLTYHFPPQNPRINQVIVVNGYVRTEKAWRENSRVKKLRMYVDDRPFAMLNLSDTRQEQVFTFEPLGHADRQDYDRLLAKPWWTMRFEIMEVYPGEKFDDTVITEIYFDGIDVH